MTVLQTLIEVLLVVWLVVVLAVVVRFIWWVVSPLPESDVRVVVVEEPAQWNTERITWSGPADDVEEAYARIHEQAHKEKS